MSTGEASKAEKHAAVGTGQPDSGTEILLS